MATAAEQSVVVESALSAAIRDRHDVVGLPARFGGAPCAAGRTVICCGLGPRPVAVRLDDVESADLADPPVTLLQLLADVPRAAADLPLVNARVAAEGATGLRHGATAPAADRLAGGIPRRFAPLLGRDDAAPLRAHACTIGADGPRV